MSKKFNDAVNKKVGHNVIAKGNEILELPRIPTGSLSLDVETGGGIPVGRITGIIGDWSSGKTAVTLKIVGEFQKKWPNKDVYWIDAEGVWDPKWSKVLGVNTEAINVVRPQHAQQAYDIILGAIEDGAGLIALDSIASLAPKEELEADMETVTVGLMARINSRFMRKMKKWEEKPLEGDIPPTFIYINQMRVNVGGYGSPETETGGKALVYYPSLKIILRKGDLFDGKKIYRSVTANDEGVEVVAQAIKFYTEKNKTAPFKRRGHFWFYFDGLDSFRPKGSYDRLEEIIRLAKKYDIVIQRGSIFDVLVNKDTGELRSFKGSNALAEFIRENDTARQLIEERVMQRVIEDMTDAPVEREGEEGSDVQEEQQVHRLRAVDLDEEEGEEEGEGTWSETSTS